MQQDYLALRLISNQTNSESFTTQLLTSQWLIHLTDQIRISSSSSSFLPPPLYPLSSIARRQYKQLCQQLPPHRIALVCLQELTRVGSYDKKRGGIPANALAGKTKNCPIFIRIFTS